MLVVRRCILVNSFSDSLMHVSFVMLVVRPSILVNSFSGSLMHVSFLMLVVRPSILMNSFTDSLMHVSAAVTRQVLYLNPFGPFTLHVYICVPTTLCSQLKQNLRNVLSICHVLMSVFAIFPGLNSETCYLIKTDILSFYKSVGYKQSSTMEIFLAI